MAKSPTLEGLRMVFRRPLLGWAEVAWRWSFAVATWLLVCLLLFEYLASLPVTKGDLLLLRSGVPWVVLATIRHILMSGAGRFAAAAAILVGAVGALWILAASAGRNATLRVLVDHFGCASAQNAATGWQGSSQVGSKTASENPWPSASLLSLHFLRAELLFTTVLSIAGAVFLSGFASSERDPRPGLVFLLFLGIASFIVVVWKALDWILSIAPIFSVAEARDTFGSVLAAWAFLGTQTRAVVGATVLTGVIHLAIFLTVTSIVSFPLTFVGIVPGWILGIMIMLLTLAYFAIADFLYLARLAAYVYLLRLPSDTVPSATVVPQSSSLPPARVDDENILSDIAGLPPPPEPA